ncbi:MAG: porin family protein [Acidobacteria bacterium]|nr:MAG: porin family protein [Acidobacteriota bacterium]
MRSPFAIAVVCIGLVLLVGSVQAQEKPLTLYGGLGYAKSMNDDAPGGSIGIQGGMIYRLQDKPFALGGEFGYLMLGSDDVDGGLFFPDSEVTLSTIPLTGQAYFLIPSEGMAPYLTGGLGFYVTKYDIDFEESDTFDTDDSNTDLGINLGGGLMFGDPSQSVRFGADARLHIIMTEDESTNVIALMARIFI